MKKYHFIFVLSCLLSGIFYGQNHAKLYLNAESQSSQIRLRWAIDNPLAWQLANCYGYTLERIEILNHQVVTDVPIRKILNDKPIKPADTAFWKEKFDAHDSYAILSQALFGEDFQTSFQANHLLFQAAGQTQEHEQRFSIALLAADRCFEAACLAGLGWIDFDVDPDRTYLYRLYVNTPDSLILCDTARILISSSEKTVYPKIGPVFSESGDKSVYLSWNIKRFKGIYTGYIIEKSKDKKQFVNLTHTASSNMLNDGETSFFIDSLESNEQTYYYRVSGITVFGTKGPVSDVVQIVGMSDFMAYPDDLTLEEKGGHSILRWTFEEESLNYLSHFLILHQSDLNAESSVFSQLSAKERTCTLNVLKLEPSNYFTIVAVYKNGQQRQSFSHFYQLLDSIPPLAPKGVQGIADSFGVVQLCWSKNYEPDLIGYRVFRANQADQEIIQVSKTLCPDTVFYDTISTNTSKHVYYQVVAVDHRGNMSEFSVQADIKRMNPTPPLAKFSDSATAFSAVVPTILPVPKIKAFADRENRQIVLNWQAVYPISEVQLFRKKDGEDWYLLEILEPANNSYKDTKLELNSTYLYRLKCVNDAGNHSPVSSVVRVIY